MRPGKSISLSLFLSLLFFPRPSRVGYSLTANDSTRICNTAGRACIYSRRSSVTFDRVLTSYIRRTRFSVINVLIFRIPIRVLRSIRILSVYDIYIPNRSSAFILSWRIRESAFNRWLTVKRSRYGRRSLSHRANTSKISCYLFLENSVFFSRSISSVVLSNLIARFQPENRIIVAYVCICACVLYRWNLVSHTCTSYVVILTWHRRSSLNSLRRQWPLNALINPLSGSAERNLGFIRIVRLK